MKDLLARHREDLERAGIRGIDVDYATDNPNKAEAEEAINSVLVTELERWREVKNKLTASQWAYFAATDDVNQYTVALRRAGKAVVKAWKNRVLAFKEKKTQ